MDTMKSIPARQEDLRSALKGRAPITNQQNGLTYFNWFPETSESLQNSKIASLKYLLGNANEKLKAHEVPTNKTRQTQQD